MKTIFIFAVLVLSIPRLSFAADRTNCTKVDGEMDNAIRLVNDFLVRISGETDFSYEEGVRFFGPVPTFNLHTRLLMDLGYLSPKVPGNGKWLKPKPLLSPLGYLVKKHRNLFLPEESSKKPIYVVGQMRYLVDDAIRTGTQHYYTVYVQHYLSDGSLGKLLGVRYNSVSDCLMFPITVNGRDITRDLGFISDSKTDWALDPSLVEELNKIP